MGLFPTACAATASGRWSGARTRLGVLWARTEGGTGHYVGWNATKAAPMEAAVESRRRVALVGSQGVCKFVPLCLIFGTGAHRPLVANSTTRLRLRVALSYEHLY